MCQNFVCSSLFHLFLRSSRLLSMFLEARAPPRSSGFTSTPISVVLPQLWPTKAFSRLIKWPCCGTKEVSESALNYFWTLQFELPATVRLFVNVMLSNASILEKKELQVIAWYTCVSILVTDNLIRPSPVASAVLVTASTEVDKTGASYYGEQTLHYLATNGESAVVQLRKCPLQVCRFKPCRLRSSFDGLEMAQNSFYCIKSWALWSRTLT